MNKKLSNIFIKKSVLFKKGVIYLIYLDNNATTKVLPEVKEAMLKYLTEEYGNPSSKYYQLALNAKSALELARMNVAKVFGCSQNEVIFTSGSTESNNMILKGIADVTDKKHLIVSSIEHPSILETARYLEKKGFRVSYIEVDSKGLVNIEKLLNEISEDTFLVSIMWVNNELGSINDIEKIAKLCKEKNVYFHVDATQAVGKIDVTLPDGVTSASFSGHKIYGPKGVGATILKKDIDGISINISPLIHGGEQEFGLRAGTQSMHNIVGLSKACEIVLRDFSKNERLLIEKEKFLCDLLKDKLGDNLIFNSPKDNKVPGVINFQIKGIKNVIFLKKISDYIAASSGSACSMTHPSYTLKAIGLTDNEIESSIRFSLSPYEDIIELKNIL